MKEAAACLAVYVITITSLPELSQVAGVLHNLLVQITVYLLSEARLKVAEHH